MIARIQIRRGTAAEWASANPVLYIGEMGYESDTGKLKFGDGSTDWNALAYWAGAEGPTGPQGPEGPAGADGATGPAGSSLLRPAAALSSSGGVVTINLASTTEVYTLTLTENVTSWVFNNLPASGYVAEIRIDVVQHASSAKTCVSPASSTSTAGGAWTVSPALSSVESLGLVITHAGAVALYPSGVLA